MFHPYLDQGFDGRAADFQNVAVTTDGRAHRHRTQERHAANGDGGHPPFGHFARYYGAR